MNFFVEPFRNSPLAEGKECSRIDQWIYRKLAVNDWLKEATQANYVIAT